MSVSQIAQLPPVGVSNQYSVSRKEQVPTRELTLTIDSETGLLSLGNIFTVSEIRHAHEWLRYQEPETHCLALGEEVSKLTNISEGAIIAGLSWKDAGLMESLARFSHKTTILYPRALQRGPAPELGTWERDSIDVQELISDADLGVNGQQFSFISARHILEHAASIENFMAALATKVHPGGYVLLEVPDCEEAIENCDYSLIWEEHIHYFTVDSLERTLQRLGWRVVKITRELVEEEAILIAIAQPPREISRPLVEAASVGRLCVSTNFGKKFEERRQRVLNFLRETQRTGSRLYILGANHSASNFIDLFGEAGLFVGCLDDNPKKQGKYISSLNVPIISLEALPFEMSTFVVSAIHLGRTELAEKKLLDILGSRVVIRRVAEVIVHCGELQGEIE